MGHPAFLNLHGKVSLCRGFVRFSKRLFNRDVVWNGIDSFAEEIVFALLEQVRAHLGISAIEAVLVDHHRLQPHPAVPGFLADVCPDALSQFAWNGRRNPYEYLEEFCRVYYGLAGQQVLDVMNFYNPKLRKFSRIELGSIEVTHRMLPDNLIRRGRRLLDDAANQVTGVELERLKRFRMTFEMQARAAELYRALCTNLNERTKESDELFRRLSADYLKYWADNDLDETCSPFSWPILTNCPSFQ